MMARIEETIDIGASIERVFGAITDPDRAQEWTPEIIEITGFSGYPVGLGTEWTQVVMLGNRPAHLHMRVVDWNPPHAGVMQISGDQKGRITTACRETSGGTRVTHTIDFEPPGGMLGKMLAGALGGMLTRELHKTLTRQKEGLEREGRGS